ncbi:lanthionine synthetase LanC family protein [Hymenobacter canadensis]|uniref:Uncharacterized protein n=1 Tax=Hymenobacter canadensis TaxID=2999067 RepID=A0ABY7LYD0_9BACT|nr:lanthionine synthetase LanC family protein [Hymenobacter canadensis]WBA44275.1 hypothetical protein O3303_21610 [Hymenobacter canadensis]
MQGWQLLHSLLIERNREGVTLLQLLSSTCYQYCVHTVFGQKQDAVLIQKMGVQILDYLSYSPLKIENEHLVLLAWLYPRLRVQQPVVAQRIQTVLRAHDQNLLQECLMLFPAAANRARIFSILRYFSLRLDDEGIRGNIQLLLPLCAQLEQADPILLGLTSGQAGELLLLVRLCRKGLSDSHTQQKVRDGILTLLPLRQAVDFGECRYSIFPDHFCKATGQISYSAEMNWHQGDLGQAWVLYEAHDLLKDAELAKIAELVGLSTLLRTTSCTTGIVCAQFDRGAAGVVMLYRKLYQLSGHPAYKQGYHSWLDQTLKLVRQELAAGIEVLPVDDLRQGLMGVGLVLLSSLTEQELDWQEFML